MPDPRTRLRPEIAALVGVALVAGVVLRFVAASPMWLDEALSANIAELPPSEIIDALRRDGHPPLYYLLLHAWGAVFGTSDVALRALSGVLALVALPLVWVAGRRLVGGSGGEGAGPVGGPVGGWVAGWVAVAVLAMNPFVLRYATENRMYSLVAVEVLVIWLMVRDLWAGRPARWRVPVLAVAAGALLWTQYWGVFLLGAVGLLALWRWWRGEGAERRGAAWSVLGLVVGGMLFVPWLGVLADQMGSTGTPWAVGARPTAAVGEFLTDLATGPPNESALFAALFGVVVVLGVFGRAGRDAALVDLDVRTVPTVRAEAAVIVLTLGVGTTVGWLTDTAFASRYAMVVVPLVVLVLTAGIVVVRHRVARAILLALVLSAGVVATGNHLTYARTQAAEWADAIAAEAQPGDVVALCPDQLGPAAERALRQRLGDDLGGLVVVGVPALDDPRFVDWRDYAERNEAADPTAVAASLVELAGSQGSVVMVWNPVYLSYEGLCEGIVASLGVTYPESRELVVSGAEDFFEHGTVTWFGR